jgi:hypothetical protein
MSNPYSCPRCDKSLPDEHELHTDSIGDPNGWICPDGTVIWIWPTGWHEGLKPEEED